MNKTKNTSKRGKGMTKTDLLLKVEVLEERISQLNEDKESLNQEIKTIRYANNNLITKIRSIYSVISINFGIFGSRRKVSKIKEIING